MKRQGRMAAILLALCAACAVHAEPLTVGRLVTAVMRKSPEYLRNQARLEGSEYDYRSSLASLFPSFTVSIPASFRDTLHSRQAGGLELTGQYGLAGGPTLSVAQLLPTSGVLTASVTDQLKVDGLESVLPAVYEASYPPGTRLSNEAVLYAGLSQPLYFGDAYGAGRKVLEGTRRSGQIRGGSGRNAVMIQAVSDYYALKKTLYSISLIEARIGSDRGNLDRAEKELSLGRGTPATVLAAKAAVLKSETDLLEAQLSYDTSFRRFRAACGLEEGAEMDPAVPALSIPPVDAEAAVAGAMSGNPDVLTAGLLAELKRAEIVMAGKDNAPTFKMEAAFTLANGLGDSATSSQTASLSAGLNLKLSDGGAFENAMKRRGAELAELESAMRSAAVQAEAEVRAMADLLTRLGKLRELYLLQEDAAEGEHQRVLKNRELGNATDADAREAQMDLEAVRMTIQQNTIDSNLAYLRLLAVQGLEVADALSKETGP